MTGVMKREGRRHTGRGDESGRDETGGGGRGRVREEWRGGRAGEAPARQDNRVCVCV